MDVLIKAIGKTPPELNVHLEIVGGGEVRPALEALVQRLGLGSRVKFLGLASDEDLRKAYIQADLFCMPGTAELQSLVTLEAMSASTPVVLADAMALPHLVRDGAQRLPVHPQRQRRPRQEDHPDPGTSQLTSALPWARPAGRWWSRTASRAPCRPSRTCTAARGTRTWWSERTPAGLLECSCPAAAPRAEGRGISGL